MHVSHIVVVRIFVTFKVGPVYKEALGSRQFYIEEMEG
jgi:hypothetical protein